MQNPAAVESLSPHLQQIGRAKRPAPATRVGPLLFPPLAKIAWGQPDPKLGAFVCSSLERTMPSDLWTWQHDHRPKLLSILGYVALAGAVLLILVAARVA